MQGAPLEDFCFVTLLTGVAAERKLPIVPEGGLGLQVQQLFGAEAECHGSIAVNACSLFCLRN
jgi:hypothetical protein